MTQQFGSDQRRPFLAAPNPQRYFAAGAIEEARLRIARSIARREGPALVIGAAGTGKSLLLAVLAEQFASRVAVVTLAGAQLCTRRALLQMILCELDLPYRGMDEGELRLSILQYLRGADATPANVANAVEQISRPRRGLAHFAQSAEQNVPVPFDAKKSAAKPQAKAAPRRLLLLVDEADSLPVRLLEELRVLTNAACEGLPLVSLVLAGGPTLEERFADPQLETFSQRLAARTYLAPFSREETFQYVAAQVAAAGMQPEALFAPDALEAIHAVTHGVPRLINQLGDQLAWLAEQTGCAPLDSALVQQAWSDLQQLPAPWNTADHPAACTSGGVIEFGDLGGDDADAESFAAAADENDDRPASIPIAAARRVEKLDIADDPTERLLARREPPGTGSSCAVLGARNACPPSDARSAEAKPIAHDPFAECFAEEEVLLDPYAALKAELMRTAPQVINRLDRAFAADLDRCIVEVEARGLAHLAESAEQNVPVPFLSAEGTGSFCGVRGAKSACPPSVSIAAIAAADAADGVARIRLHDLAPPAEADGYSALQSYGDVLVIDDDDRPAANIVAGRQFRRLFSCLESTAGRSLLG